MTAKREKKPIRKVKMTEGKRQIIQQLLREYDIEPAEDIRNYAGEKAEPWRSGKSLRLTSRFNIMETSKKESVDSFGAFVA